MIIKPPSIQGNKHLIHHQPSKIGFNPWRFNLCFLHTASYSSCRLPSRRRSPRCIHTIEILSDEMCPATREVAALPRCGEAVQGCRCVSANSSNCYTLYSACYPPISHNKTSLAAHGRFLEAHPNVFPGLITFKP